MTECESSNENGDTGKDGIEQVEGTHRADADEVEERPLPNGSRRLVGGKAKRSTANSEH